MSFSKVYFSIVFSPCDKDVRPQLDNELDSHFSSSRLPRSGRLWKSLLVRPKSNPVGFKTDAPGQVFWVEWPITNESEKQEEEKE